MHNNFNKTEAELRLMNDDELFAYLDAKAEHLKQFTKPLDPYRTKRSAYVTAAIENKNKGTDEVFLNVSYDTVKGIIKENEARAINILQTKKMEECNKIL